MATYYCRDCKEELLGGEYVYGLNDAKICPVCKTIIEERFFATFGIRIWAGNTYEDFEVGIGDVERLLETLQDDPDNSRIVLDYSQVIALREGQEPEIDTINVNADLFRAVVLALYNRSGNKDFPVEVQEELEKADQALLKLAVKRLNLHNRKVGEEETD